MSIKRFSFLVPLCAALGVSSAANAQAVQPSPDADLAAAPAASSPATPAEAAAPTEAAPPAETAPPIETAPPTEVAPPTPAETAPPSEAAASSAAVPGPKSPAPPAEVAPPAETAVSTEMGSRAQRRSRPRATWGGFGYVSAAGFAGSYGNLESDLSQATALGADFELGALAFQAGAGAKVLFPGGLMVGGKGGIWLPSMTKPTGGEVGATASGGGIDLGYAVINKANYLVYPYFGVAGYGMDVEVTNKLATGDLRIGDDALSAGATRTYSAGFFVLDFGLGMQRLLFGSHNGGALVGFEGGFLTTISRGEWSDDTEREISGLSELGVSGGYLRITVGGGAFAFAGL